MRISDRGIALALLGMALVCGLGGWGALRSESSSLTKSAAIAYCREEYAQAWELASAELQQHPDSPAALRLAAESKAKLGETAEAFALAQKAVAAGDRGALFLCGDRALLLGHARQAEHFLREHLRFNPYHIESNLRLAWLLAVEGRTWESRPALWQVIRSGKYRPEYLIMAGARESILIRDARFQAACAEADSNDPLPLLGVARRMLVANDAVGARALFERIVARDPEQYEAQSRLGRILVDANSDEVAGWNARLPANADEHPEVWLDRGLWAQTHGQHRAAARCFWEALRRDPDDRAASYHLSQVLKAVDPHARPERFAEHARAMDRLELLMAELRVASTPELLRTAVELLDAAGRQLEAVAWARIARANAFADTAWADAYLRRISASRQNLLDLRRFSPAATHGLDLSREPLPDFGARGRSAESSGTSKIGAARVRFEEEPGALDFQYFNGADPKAGRAYMFEFSGGGVGVVDFDGDGRPDIYLTQGCRWPVQPGQQEFLDRLFWNRGDGRFEDITQKANLYEDGFSQGVSAGDIDGDGFADLYVGNIGPNRLYRNNGDGTYSDATAQSGAAGSDWTSSTLIADLNGDAWPDIYAVNYLGGDVFERACLNGHVPAQCAPTMFPGAQDRVYLSNGDGSFRDATESSGIQLPDGKGLGIVAADFHGSGQLSLFIANDTTANFLFVNETRVPGGPLTFAERAIASGVAFDADGRAQACMGIGVADCDGDGLLDLFVTNFYNESNTLYLQQSPLLFSDETRRAGLRDPGFDKLGFGTQFLDGELDGWPDLIVTNGHINDFRDEKIPYQMRPQYYRNRGSGEFDEAPPQGLGPYFEGKYLGRALARLDWNADGLADVVVTHIDRPPALLTNRTASVGRYLALELRAVHSARDAIGATVRVRLGDRVWMQQLTAGDGFECSNQRQLVFGLGDHDAVDECTIRWRSGREQTFRNLPVGQRLLVIEGRSSPVLLP